MRGFRAAQPEQAETAAGRGTSPDNSALPSDVIEAGPPPRRLLPRATSGRWLVGLGVALGVAMVLIAVLAFRLGSGSAARTDQQPAPTPTPVATAAPLATPELYRRLAPSVVLITTSKGSLGSGTIVTDTGTILTAHHVIAGGGTVTVAYADGTKSSATLASDSPKTDTATLTPQKLPEVVVPATLGGGVEVGADVTAIGNPLGLRLSTTTGIVSGLGRTSKTAMGTVTGTIQFDAAVNPGSSGGPLLNDQGDLVGVVVSIADPGKDDAFAGIAFAVPIGAALSGGNEGSGPGGGPQL